MYIAGLWHPALRELSSGLRERERERERRRGEGACEAWRRERGECVRERRGWAQRDTATSWGEVNPVSPKSGGRKKKETQSGQRESVQREDICCFFSSCLGGWRESLDGVISSTMGCSLCTLQKPEEQYKLLYEVCQVLWPSLQRGSLRLCLSCFLVLFFSCFGNTVRAFIECFLTCLWGQRLSGSSSVWGGVEWSGVEWSCCRPPQLSRLNSGGRGQREVARSALKEGVMKRRQLSQCVC